MFALLRDGRHSESNVNIGVQQLPSDVTLGAYRQENIAFLGLTPGFKLLSLADEVLAGAPAYQIRYRGRAGTEPFIAVQVTSIIDGYVYTLNYSSTPDEFDTYFVDAGLIVRSFSLTTQ